jgi:ActR/RegA family two-component response regulator
MGREMPATLKGATVLIAEDNALQAWDLKLLFKAQGAVVLGPVKSVTDALSIANTEQLNCAVLDVMLGQDNVFPVAQLLNKRGIGIVFYTGTGNISTLKQDYPNAQIMGKPASATDMIEAVQVASRLQR